MRRPAVLVLAALLASAASAAPPPPPAVSPVKPLVYTTRTLANGLRVFAMPDRSTANVAIEVIYDVGAKNDPAGRSGFAHMFEHLMFKSTRNLVPEQFDRLTEDVGGNNNASTHDDFTEYHEVVPASHLQPLLFAEAERMGSLVVDQPVFASERHVVEEELRQGEARPYGKLFQTYLPAISYSVHPYARSPIGSIADLDAATIDDIRAFHATYYRPDNAVLVVAGNFDPAQLDRWVDRYFGPLKTPVRPIPRVTAVEPPRTRATTLSAQVANTPLPAVAISWPAPPARSADDPALSVLDAILSAGESSRLYETLVYRDQLATAAGSSLDDRHDTGMFVAYAILAGGKSAADGEAALRREIARLRDAPVSAAELDIAKNQLLTTAIKARETALGRAMTLAEAVVVNGDPAAADRDVAAIAAVTPADVERVARRYLRDEASAVIRYLPAAAGASDTPVTVAATVQVAPLAVPPDVPVVVAAAPGQRILPPAPAAPLPVPTPVVTERTLANGLHVAVASRHDVPLIAAVLVTPGGAAADRPGRAGTAELMATLLTKGTATRSATQIAHEIEALGGSIGAGAGWDGTTLSVSVKADRIAPALAVMADVARHPAFAAPEIERARTQAIDAAGIAMTDPRAVARMTATKAVFGDTTYGHVAAGTPKSLKAITRADVAALYALDADPGTATLVFTGDIDIDAAAALATTAFGAWRRPGTPATAPVPGAAAAYPAPRTIVVDLPGASQASVVVARPGLSRADPAYYSATVANTALGGGFSSRLNSEIRIKRGLAYGASSGLDARRGIGSLTSATATKNASAPEVAGVIDGEWKRLASVPVAGSELAVSKAILTGRFGQEVETVSGLAGRLAGLAVDGVPLSELAAYSAKVDAVTPAGITGVAATLFDPARASTIVVGDAKTFLPGFAAAGRKVEVIPVARLDLDAAVLP